MQDRILLSHATIKFIYQIYWFWGENQIRPIFYYNLTLLGY